MEKETLTVSEFAREAGVKPSYIDALLKGERIIGAYRDENNGKWRIPNKRHIIIPPKHPRHKSKVGSLYIPRENTPDDYIKKQMGIPLDQDLPEQARREWVEGEPDSAKRSHPVKAKKTNGGEQVYLDPEFIEGDIRRLVIDLGSISKTTDDLSGIEISIWFK